jgi:hypothetical protein
MSSSWGHDHEVNAQSSSLGVPLCDRHRLGGRYGVAFGPTQELERLSVQGNDHILQLAEGRRRY